MRWLASDGEPGAEVGQDGDLCICRLTGYTYQRQAGRWVCYGKGWHD